LDSLDCNKNRIGHLPNDCKPQGPKIVIRSANELANSACHEVRHGHRRCIGASRDPRSQLRMEGVRRRSDDARLIKLRNEVSKQCQVLHGELAT
jgi:hypothetical protein